MLDQLKTHVDYVDIKTRMSEVQAYHDYLENLDEPDMVCYRLRAEKGREHVIKFDSRLAPITNKWHTPLTIRAITVDGKRVPFVFAEQGDRLCVPHILVSQGDNPRCDDLSLKLAKKIARMQRLWEAQSALNETLDDIKRCTVAEPSEEPTVPVADADYYVKLKYSKMFQSYHLRLMAWEQMAKPLAEAKKHLAALPEMYEDVWEEVDQSGTSMRNFMEFFLEQCPVPVRIRHILTYIVSLNVNSGK